MCFYFLIVLVHPQFEQLASLLFKSTANLPLHTGHFKNLLSFPGLNQRVINGLWKDLLENISTNWRRSHHSNLAIEKRRKWRLNLLRLRF